MRRLYLRFILAIKRGLPTSLFGRSLLIFVIPIILVQAVAVYVFYERHWESVTRNMSSSLAGEVSLLVHEVREPNLTRRQQWAEMAEDLLGIEMRFLHAPLLPLRNKDPRFSLIHRLLHERIGLPATVEQLPDDGDVIIRVALPDALLEMTVSKKRLVSSTTYIFTLWLVRASLALSTIAILFLRGQIRPIGRLARAAEGFGMGIEDPLFRPHGSREVRQAARAFLTMKSRISRQIATRTAMLSGISHDLRTPLTRMKLQLAMLPPSEEIELMLRDVNEMEQMIGEYLAFARGEDGEAAETVPLAEFLQEIVGSHQSAGEPVTLRVVSDGRLSVRRQRIKRALDNLIVNALRYGQAAHVTLEVTPRQVFIHVDDNGPGIPESEQETVFQPFKRLEASRNVATGGVGLGLTIAREAVQAQGGDIELRNRVSEGTLSGLRATVRLPMAVV